MGRNELSANAIAASTHRPHRCSEAHPELLGPVTSQRRHLLLDGIAAAIGLARYLGLDGDILDIGCHAGISEKGTTARQARGSIY